MQQIRVEPIIKKTQNRPQVRFWRSSKAIAKVYSFHPEKIGKAELVQEVSFGLNLVYS